MRKTLLKKVKRVVVKIGSGILTSASGQLSAIAIGRIASEIALLTRERGYEFIVVTSGAVASGRGVLGWQGRSLTIPEKQASAAVGQGKLIRAYTTAFERHGMQTAQILITSDDLSDRTRYINVKNTLKTLIGAGAIPIINENDTVAFDEIKVGDNDNLAAMVTHVSESGLLVILSDIDGLYDRSPKGCDDAMLIGTVKNIDSIQGFACGTESEISIGGMVTKIEAARKVTGNGKSLVIANGRTKGVLTSILSGENTGTVFLPSVTPESERKLWIGHTQRVKGKIFVDEGAVTAMTTRHTSLLPRGVQRVEGNFRGNELVSICNLSGFEFAKGISSYSSDELTRIMGRRSGEIESILGFVITPEAVERDNLVISRGDA